MSLFQTIEETKIAIDSVADEKKVPLVKSLITLTKKVMTSALSFKDIPENFETVILPGMTSQLEAAEKRTEKAADSIMTSTEKIMSALGDIEGKGKDIIQTEVNNLFEACNFQDLVAQHLNEIKLLTDDLAADMSDLSAAMNEMGEGGENGSVAKRPRKEKRPDSHLLNGPSTDF